MSWEALSALIALGGLVLAFLEYRRRTGTSKHGDARAAREEREAEQRAEVSKLEQARLEREQSVALWITKRPGFSGSGIGVEIRAQVGNYGGLHAHDVLVEDSWVVTLWLRHGPTLAPANP